MITDKNFDLRMESFLTQKTGVYLDRNQPVVLLLNGVAFRIFCKDFETPYDQVVVHSMRETLQFLCKVIPGVVFGHTHADDLLLVLKDSSPAAAPAYCDYNTQQLCSTVTSIATMKFNKLFEKAAKNYTADISSGNKTTTLVRAGAYINSIMNGAVFRCKCLNVPREDLADFLFWRQLKAIDHSVYAIASYYFNQLELKGLSTEEMVQMMREQRNARWNEYSAPLKWGSACYFDASARGSWYLDSFMPLLTEESRDYIYRFI